VDPYADKVFSIHQNSFIKGMDIMDGVLSLHDLMHHAHVKKWVGSFSKFILKSL
jgi:hypothetical protein